MTKFIYFKLSISKRYLFRNIDLRLYSKRKLIVCNKANFVATVVLILGGFHTVVFFCLAWHQILSIFVSNFKRSMICGIIQTLTIKIEYFNLMFYRTLALAYKQINAWKKDEMWTLTSKCNRINKTKKIFCELLVHYFLLCIIKVNYFSNINLFLYPKVIFY